MANNLTKFVLFFLMGFIVLLGLNWTGFVDWFSDEETGIVSATGSPARDFTPYHSALVPQLKLKNLKGEVFSLENIKGKAFLLNFWASWCAPCREEFPDLISAVKWSKGRLALVAISNDSSQEDIKAFLKDLKKAGVKWKQKDVHILWDPEFKVAKQFHVAKWPETFILDQEGKIVQKQAGVFSFQQLKPFLSQILTLK